MTPRCCSFLSLEYISFLVRIRLSSLLCWIWGSFHQIVRLQNRRVCRLEQECRNKSKGLKFFVHGSHFGKRLCTMNLIRCSQQKWPGEASFCQCGRDVRKRHGRPINNKSKTETPVKCSPIVELSLVYVTIARTMNVCYYSKPSWSSDLLATVC